MQNHDHQLRQLEMSNQSTYSQSRRQFKNLRGSAAIPIMLFLVIIIAGGIALCNRPEAPGADTDTGADVAEPPAGTDAAPPAPPPDVAAPDTPPPTMVVTADALNLRASPPDGAILGLAMQGQELKTTGQRQQAGGREWLEVWLPDGSGTAWAAADYLQ